MTATPPSAPTPAPTPPSDAASTPPATPPSAPPATPPAPPAGAGRVYTALLADDVQALRRLVRLALEASGRFRIVAEAATGLEAIAKSREAQPDIVLLDLSMPEVDGLEALPRVLEAAPRSHVVVLSGFNHVRMAPVALRLGASAYLEKGLEPKDLVRELVTVLEAAPPPPATDAAAKGPGQPPLSTPPAAAGPAAKPATFRTVVLDLGAPAAADVTGLLRGSARFLAAPAASVEDAEGRLAAGGVDLAIVAPPPEPAAAEDLLIRVLSAAPAVPVVALLPAQDPDWAARALRLGVEDCLPAAGLDAALLERSLLYAVERRRAQEARRSLRDQEASLLRLRELDRLKSEFFNAAAHELGTPLTPIRLQLARLRSMRKASAAADELRSLEVLDRNVHRLLRLNQDILDVARLESGHFSVERRPFRLEAVVREVVDTCEPQARDLGLRLTAECDGGLAVDGDASRLGQVLLNLVSNALKFTPAGGSVAVRAEADAEECRIAVRDTGVGLTPEQRALLFRPFSQVLGAAQPRGVGSGLGLFVSRGIVELHGGRLECASDGPGKGSTFTIALPRWSGPVPVAAAAAPLAVMAPLREELASEAA